jgi:hypothetical protein
MTWRYAGYCRADRETAIEFSVDSETNIPFDSLECLAYDLQNDPHSTHKIRPFLVGPDGMSKKIAVPFLAPVLADQPFNIVLKCSLPGCLKGGIEYYTSTLSFDQSHVGRYTVRLLFLCGNPTWVRAYERGVSGRPRLLRDLRPVREEPRLTEYEDADENVDAQSARIYLFWREPSRQDRSSER